MNIYFRIKNTLVSKTTFAVRSKTLNIKEYNPWSYEDSLCVMCQNELETMDHFVTCVEYGENLKFNWKDIYGENMKIHF